MHIAKQDMALDGSMQSRITATMLNLAAEIERELMSQRPSEALARPQRHRQSAAGTAQGPHSSRPEARPKAKEIRGLRGTDTTSTS
jgi:hypothetical protein